MLHKKRASSQITDRNYLYHITKLLTDNGQCYLENLHCASVWHLSFSEEFIIEIQAKMLNQV